MTIRKLYQTQAGASGHYVFVGTPAEAADVMQDWFESRGCDGWNLIPPFMPGPATECLEWLVPELQCRGIFHTEYEGDGTLRGSLGLPRPAFHSRGAHAREDFPKRDDQNWLKHTLCWRGDGGDLRLDYRPVHLQPLSNDVATITPKERVY